MSTRPCLVITYRLCYQPAYTVELCASCTDGDAHGQGALSEVSHGAHLGYCVGASHGGHPVPLPRRGRGLAAAMAVGLLAFGSSASAAPRRTPRPETTVRAAKEQSAAAAAGLKAARSKAKAASHKLRLAKARIAADKAAKRLAHEEQIEACIEERTGPAHDGGIDEDEATAICSAEVE